MYHDKCENVIKQHKGMDIKTHNINTFSQIIEEQIYKDYSLCSLIVEN